MDREAVREVFLPRREDCLEYLRKIRWKEGVKCPKQFPCKGLGRSDTSPLPCFAASGGLQ